MSVQVQKPQQRPYPAPSGDGFARPAGAPAAEAAPQPAARRRPGFLTRRVLLPVLGVVLVVAAIVAFNTYRTGQLYVSTDNAQLTTLRDDPGLRRPRRTIRAFAGTSTRRPNPAAPCSVTTTVSKPGAPA